jgi:hypothetical protein
VSFDVAASLAIGDDVVGLYDFSLEQTGVALGPKV